ncbi:MAG: ATP-binding protein [Tissierellia bacterium]|nr:ATP-binding protein [Tissierellia bacterium]
MKVLGITTTQEIFIGSRERNFRNNEFLIVEDEIQGPIIGEIVEARTFNRFIPLNIGGDFVDNSVLESLKVMGYDINNETIYIGKLRFFEETLYPVLTGSDVRLPHFSEIKDLLLSIDTKDSLVLGVIKNTDDLTEESDGQYQNLLHIYENKKYSKQRELPYLLDYRGMHQYPHIGVFGGSGSGKSFGLRVILEELMEKNVPTIVLDPHYEMDFSTPSKISEKNYKEKFISLQIGVDIGIKFEELTKKDIKNLLNATSHLSDSMNNVIDIMFVSGNNYYSFSNKLQLLLDAQEIGSKEKLQDYILSEPDETKRRQLEEQKKIYEKYDKTCNNQSVRGVLWRLNSLFREGIFSHGINALEDGLYGGKLIVIQGSTRLINVFSTYILSKLYHRRKEYRDAVYRDENQKFFPPFIIVTDEAHNFAPKGFDTPSKGILKEISQEGRKYGVFLILATQRPTLLDETITAQLNTKFIFRTVRASDIDTIREETDLSSDEAKRLPYLKTGDVFISSSQRGRTSFVRIRAANTTSPHTENPFDELDQAKTKSFEEFYRVIEEFLPLSTTNTLQTMKTLNEKHGLNLTYDQLNQKMKDLCDYGYIEVVEDFLGSVYQKKE